MDKYPLILSTITVIVVSSIQTISIITASFIALCSMLYRCFYPQGLTLHFIGIRRPDQFTKSQYKLLKNFQTDSTLITIQTSLKQTNTIQDLKQLIYKTYNIAENKDILISYAGHLISKYHDNDSIELHEFGISNNSLLTLAISNTSIIPENKYLGIHREMFERAPEFECVSDPVQNVNDEEDSDDKMDSRYKRLLNKMQNRKMRKRKNLKSFLTEITKTKERQLMSKKKKLKQLLLDRKQQFKIPESKEEEHEPQFLEPLLGFDVIMQEGGVMVYKMPTCGHAMNKESLYDYCVNTLKDNANKKVICPHRTRDGKCNVEWDLNAVLEVLRHEQLDETDKSLSTQATDWKDIAKLELLASRNIIENGGHNVQKCPRCQTLYFKEKQEAKLKLDEIKTKYHIEQEFRTQCIYCHPSMPQYLDQDKLRIKKSEIEIAKEGSKMNWKKRKMMRMKMRMKMRMRMRMRMRIVDRPDEDEEEEELEEEKCNAFEPSYDENGYRVLTPTDSFCFCCGEEWIEGHICDNQFRKDLIHILQTAPVKKIGQVEGVPSIRACPNPLCSQLLFHIKNCKHMHCQGCKKRYCHVCLLPTKDGKWQCGSSGDRCPIAPRQNEDTLPDNIVITKQKFTLFERIEDKENNE